MKAANLDSPATASWVPGGGEDEVKTQAQVSDMLKTIEAGREAACLKFARDLDGWTKDTVVVSPQEVAAAIATLDEQTKSDVQFQHANVRAFALEQVKSLHDFECELLPGVITGQKIVPVGCAGCYVPGGRFSHVSSAIMTVATAKASGVSTVVACSPALGDTGMIHPATLYAMHLAGADHILCIGGVQGIAAMAYGLFTGVEADVIVGPGNKVSQPTAPCSQASHLKRPPHAPRSANVAPACRSRPSRASRHFPSPHPRFRPASPSSSLPRRSARCSAASAST